MQDSLVSYKYVVITPARDEATFIQRTINSMINQTVRPAEWVIVDDGSKDGTTSLAQSAAEHYSWIKVVCLPDRGSRQVGTGSVEAFNAGLQALGTADYEFISCIDADIVLNSRYFETLFRKFANDSRLGNACGQIYEEAGGKLLKLREGDDMTFGAIKCWRRACFYEIGGLVKDASWDGIDCYQSLRAGWRTAKFDDIELQVLHLRPIGSSDRSVYRGWFRRGHSLYFLGAHPAWIMASIAYHLPDRPSVLGSLCMCAGYFEALLRQRPRYNHPELIHYIRQWQLRKLTSQLRLYWL